MANHPSHYSCEALEGLTIVYRRERIMLTNFQTNTNTRVVVRDAHMPRTAWETDQS